MAWLYLAVAAVFEVVLAVSMKYSDGFSRLGPSVMTALAAVGSLSFLTLAMKGLPVSVAYPVWTSVGTLGIVFLGWMLFDEHLDLLKLASVVAIVAGIAGLRASAG
jgi:quaternary ammonium compound-resistance protein SugE